MFVKTQKVRLYPNSSMQQYLKSACDYRRYCWNKALALWNDMYDCYKIFNKTTAIIFIPKTNKHNNKTTVIQKAKYINPKPNWRLVRNNLVADKADWEYNYSARILQLAVQDLGKAWKNFFNKSQLDWGKPKFKSKRAIKQGFKSDRAKIINDRLLLDKPHTVKKQIWSTIKLSERPYNLPLKQVYITKINNKYYGCLIYNFKPEHFAYSNKATAIDINVGHYDLPSKRIDTKLAKLNKYYKQIKYYQHCLAKKRNISKKNIHSHNYQKVKTKLQHNYEKVNNIQSDMLQKLTTKLVKHYGQITIEDLDVKQMQMSHVASKGLQRAMFGKFRQMLIYKCQWYGRKLILADKNYPSTQRCSRCGHIKRGIHKLGLKGNRLDGEDHDTFICKNCGLHINRDRNAALNLLAYSTLQKQQPKYLKRICTTQAIC